MAGLHCHLGEKAECAFRAHHKVGDDVERVVVTYKRQNIETRHVLDRVFVAYAFRKFRVGIDLVADGLNLADEFRMGLGKLLFADSVARIEQSTVGKDDAYRLEHLVAVGMGATVHARRVVDDDTAYHSRIFRSRVGGERTPEWLKDLIHALSDDARLHGNGRGIGRDSIFLPVLACDNENAVGHALTAKAGAGGAESDWQLQAAGSSEKARHFFFCLRAYHNLWHKTIEAGIGAPRQPAHLVSVDAFARDECAYFF